MCQLHGHSHTDKTRSLNPVISSDLLGVSTDRSATERQRIGSQTSNISGGGASVIATDDVATRKKPRHYLTGTLPMCRLWKTERDEELIDIRCGSFLLRFSSSFANSYVLLLHVWRMHVPKDTQLTLTFAISGLLTSFLLKIIFYLTWLLRCNR